MPELIYEEVIRDKIIELEYKRTKILDRLKELKENIKDLDEKEWTNNEVGSVYVRGIIYSFEVIRDLLEQLKKIDQELIELRNLKWKELLN